MWWRDPGAPAARQAERALELGAAGQHVALGGQRQREQARDGAARAAQRQRPAAGHAQHRVVDARLDRAVVRAGSGRRSARAARTRRRPRRRSARRRRCRWSSPAARRRRPAAGDGAGCTGASRRARPSAAPPPAPRARRGGGGASTIGRSRPAQQRRLHRPELHQLAARPRRRAAISANGFSSRCLRARSRATASSSAARHARWYPPIPLTATIAAVAAASVDDVSSSAVARGAARRPGQALGWAWKRRSGGRAYSAAQAAHIVKPAIVVSGRS